MSCRWRTAQEERALPEAAEAHLAELAARLHGPRRVVRGLLAEVRDHLEDAVDALVAAGHGREEAAVRAVADFGTVAELVPTYRTTIAVAASRRTAWLLVAAIVPQPLLWDRGLALGAGGEVPSGWLFPVLDVLVEYGGALVALGAVVAVVATGVGNRWFAAGRVTARCTAWFVLGVCAVLPLLTGAMVVVTGADAALRLWVCMCVLLFLPLALAARSARSSLAAAG